MKMASSRSLLLLLLIGLALGFSEVVRADGGIQLEPPQAVKYDYSKDIELLKSKVLSLEATIKAKDSILSEKDNQISTLETEMSSLHTHKEGAGAAEAQLASALSKVRELESQVRAVKEEAEKYKQEAKKEADRAKAVESSANAHLAEKEKVVKALSDQKSRLQKAERGLQVAEAAMLKAKAEAETKAKKLEEVHGAWLPPWAAAHAETLQKTASSRWETHAEPAVRNLQRSVSAKAMDAHGFMKPHLDTFKTKVNPVISDKWRKLTLAVAPHLETIRKAGVSSREYMSPHFETVQKTIDPYVQVVREKSRPYVDQAATFVAPHLEKVKTIAGPHYRRALTTANNYHEQLQNTVTETLSKHELLKSFATKESVWFLAAALLALPFVFAFMVLRSLFAPKKVVHHKRHRSHSGTQSSSSLNKKPRRAKNVDKLVEK